MWRSSALCATARTSPVALGFRECRFRVRGIKTSGEQCTTDWTTVEDRETYECYDPKVQAT